MHRPPPGLPSQCEGLITEEVETFLMTDQNPSARKRAKKANAPHSHSGVIHVNEPHHDNFTVVGNHLAQHPDLSLTAIGLAVHIQSLPAGAPIGIKTLAGKFTEGEIRIAAALRELEEHGYLARTKERLLSGRVTTRTTSYNKPPRDQPRRDHLTRIEPPRDQPRRDEPTGTEPRRDQPMPDEPTGIEARRDGPTRDQRVRDEREGDGSRDGEPAEGPRRTPAASRTPAPSPVPAPRPSSTAADLLAGLRAHDPRLLLTERDVHRLAPAVTEWLDRGVPPTAVVRSLTSGLPEDPINHPAAFLAHRLAAHLPPHLPAPPPPRPASTEAAPLRPAPLQNCDGCERAFRFPTPGHYCRECREKRAAA